LDLSFNNISYLPSDFGDALKGLRTLNLDGNQLTALPTCMTILTNLHSLSLAQNKIFGPVPNLSTLVKLSKLNLNDNSFTKFADGTLPNLVRLRVSTTTILIMEYLIMNNT
jgi:hypothetical protein